MTATAESRLPWLAPIALACAIGVLAALVGGAPIASPDYGWHLETGELIAETGSIPTTDPYTFTVPGARWIDTHWLFQLALHGLYELGGHQAVRLGKAACVLALVAVLGSIGWRRRRSALSALALGAMITAPLHRLIERPELVSFLFLAILLALLDRHDRRGGLSVFAIVPIQLEPAILLVIIAIEQGLARTFFHRPIDTGVIAECCVRRVNHVGLGDRLRSGADLGEGVVLEIFRSVIPDHDVPFGRQPQEVLRLIISVAKAVVRVAREGKPVLLPVARDQSEHHPDC